MPAGTTSSVHRSRSLQGKRVLITRPRGQTEDFATLLEMLGATPVILPTIQIQGPEDWGEVDRSLGRLDEYNWLFFTSGNAVE